METLSSTKLAFKETMDEVQTFFGSDCSRGRTFRMPMPSSSDTFTRFGRSGPPMSYRTTMSTPLTELTTQGATFECCGTGWKPGGRVRMSKPKRFTTR